MRMRSAIRRWLGQRIVVFAVLWPSLVLLLATEVELEGLGPSPVTSALGLSVAVGVFTLFAVAHYGVVTGVGRWIDRRFLFQPAWYEVRGWKGVPGAVIQELIRKLKLLAAVAWALPWMLLPLLLLVEPVEWVSVVLLVVSIKLLGLSAYVCGWILLRWFGAYQHETI